jgi:hypothetical protein
MRPGHLGSSPSRGGGSVGHPNARSDDDDDVDDDEADGERRGRVLLLPMGRWKPAARGARETAAMIALQRHVVPTIPAVAKMLLAMICSVGCWDKGGVDSWCITIIKIV